ncbi:hypothetical protein FOCC_FOCC015108 [Frankliniella occidentalis]|nr:hypothetical protein FOCC_FOCC015108 [Frankliniella occidentalis]
MSDPTVKAYYLFLQWILPMITGLNEYFQSDKPTITMVHSEMVATYQEFLAMFMQRDYIMRTPLQDVNPGDTSRYLGLGHVYNFADPVLSRMRLLIPEVAMSHREREKSSIATFCLLSPRCVSRDKVQAVDDEWRRLPLLTADIPAEVKTIQEPDKFWHATNHGPLFSVRLLHNKTECGEQPFQALPEFALSAISIPMANAACDGHFSKVHNTKIKSRNKLFTRTVNGCLLGSQAVRKGEGCCVKFKPSKAMFLNMTSPIVYQKSSSINNNNQEEVDIRSLFTFE